MSSSKIKLINVVDLEATCWEKGKQPEGQKQEIIEVGICVIDLTSKDKAIRNRHSWLVKPENSDVSEYCTSITGLTQKDLELAPTFGEVYKQISEKYSSASPWAAWGNWDHKMLNAQCAELGLKPLVNGTFFNLKALSAVLLGNIKESGLGATISALGMQFEGEPHRALDDAINAAKVGRKIMFGIS